MQSVTVNSLRVFGKPNNQSQKLPARRSMSVKHPASPMSSPRASKRRSVERTDVLESRPAVDAARPTSSWTASWSNMLRSTQTSLIVSLPGAFNSIPSNSTSAASISASESGLTTPASRTTSTSPPISTPPSSATPQPSNKQANSAPKTVSSYSSGNHSSAPLLSLALSSDPKGSEAPAKSSATSTKRPAIGANNTLTFSGANAFPSSSKFRAIRSSLPSFSSSRSSIASAESSTTSSRFQSPVTPTFGRRSAFYPYQRRASGALLVPNGVRKPDRNSPRKHILDRLHKMNMQENMLRSLYDLQVKKGYSGPFSQFKELRDYELRIKALEEQDILTNASSALQSNKRGPSQKFEGQGFIVDPGRSAAINKQMYRSIQIAKDALNTPRAVLPEFDRLKIASMLKDVEIENRIRPKRRKLPRLLGPVAEAKSEEVLKRRGIVASCLREQLQPPDVQRLRPSKWLNDEIINFYGAMVMERAQRWEKGEQDRDLDPWYGLEELDGTVATPRSAKVNGIAPAVRNCSSDHNSRRREFGEPLRIHYFNTFFYAKLVMPGYAQGRLNKWTRLIDIFSKDAVLIPINMSNTHWTYACINMRLKRVEFYDSLGGRRDLVFRRLREYLDLEHRDKKLKPFDFEGWEDYHSEATPRQENAHDCGVFTCQFMEGTSRGEDGETFGFDQGDMPYLRKRMLWEISENRLAGWKIASSS